MPSFPFVVKGQRVEVPSAEFHNAIVAAINSSPQLKRALADPHAFSVRDKSTPRRDIYLRAHEDIDRFSIFTIDFSPCGTSSCDHVTLGTASVGYDETMEFDYKWPKVFSKKITTSGGVLVANQAQGLSQNVNYTLKILGDEEPVIVRYTGVPPLPGDTLGPVPNTYTVSKAYTGLVAISGPDLDASLVWVIRVGNAALGLTEFCLAENHPGQGIPFNVYRGVWNPVTHEWDYTCEETEVAIDWRYGVPYPDAGAKGLFIERESETYGTIQECVSLDCESAGECCPEY